MEDKGDKYVLRRMCPLGKFNFFFSYGKKSQFISKDYKIYHNTQNPI